MITYPIQPWQHQLAAIERAKHTPEFALLYDMGCGKTSTATHIIRHKFAHHGRVLRTLVLCPLIVVENWHRELEKHGGLGCITHCLIGSATQKIKKIDAALNQTLSEKAGLTRILNQKSGIQKELHPAPILVTNFESLNTERVYSKLRAFKPEILIVDESQRVKNPQAARTKRTIELADPTLYRYILSGTPILNSILDIYSQFRVLDKGDTFGKSFYFFRAQYCYDRNAGMPKQSYFPDWVPRPDSAKAIQKMIEKKSMRVEKSDCLDLPPLVKKSIFVELGLEQKKHYEAMKQDFITFLESRACTAPLAITKALRLQQICSGYIKLEDGAVIPLKHNPRIDALKELLSDLTPRHKVIIWAIFSENYRQIRMACEELNIEYAELHGEIDGVSKTTHIERFSSDPLCRVIIANQQSAGLGVELTRASYSIYFSRNFSLEHDLQSEARNYRSGSEIHEKVTRIDIVAQNTIDETVLEALAEKQDIASQILAFQNRI